MSNQVKYHDKYYSSIEEACNDLHLSYESYKFAFIKYECSSDEVALDIAKSYDNTMVEYRGICFRSFTNMCKKLRVCSKTFYKRIKEGYRFYEALDYCVLKSNFKFSKVDDNLFDCTCKRCNKKMILTLDLAIKHIKECYNE